MTKKHFTELAALVARVVDEGGDIDAGTLALRLADFCAEHGKNFDRQRFLTATAAAV